MTLRAAADAADLFAAGLWALADVVEDTWHGGMGWRCHADVGCRVGEVGHVIAGRLRTGVRYVDGAWAGTVELRGARSVGMRTTGGVAVIAAMLTMAAVGAGASNARATGGSGRPVVTAAARADTAVSALARLQVRGRAPKTGYSRSHFPHWVDLDRDGCDPRNETLARQMWEVRRVGACRVTSGRLVDPYSGRAITWVANGPQLIDIDHVVSLGDAWVSGAWDGRSWTPAERRPFANDPLNLLAVDARLNRSKGDSNAASWVPPDKGYRCAFAARQVAVKSKYRLSVTPAEKAALQRYLAPGCALPSGPAGRLAAPRPTTPPRPVPTPTAAPSPTASPTVAPSATASPTTAPSPAGAPSPAVTTSPPSAAGVYYANCAAARAAGAAPIRIGQPGYRAGLDRDGDGIACE